MKHYQKLTVFFFVVILLLGIAPKITKVIEQNVAEYKARREKELQEALEQKARWEAECQAIKTTQDKFAVLISQLAEEGGKFSREEREPTLDAWETPIKITFEEGQISDSVTLFSAGPDQTFDTADDLSQKATTTSATVAAENLKDKAVGTAKGLWQRIWK